ncbi:MAG: hypothetical protein QME07_01480 [bacterium]|nr:hypothetical protein [bacterium]
MKEQEIYAKFLNVLSKIGLGLVVITFILYVGELLPAKIPLQKISEYWSLSCEEYLRSTGIHSGWSWLHLLGYGDFVTFLAITFLAITTIICYLAIIPSYLRRNDKIYCWLAIIEVVVLITAASGILSIGGH